MQVRTNRAGEVVGAGSINHTELARLQAAARKKHRSAEPKPEPKSEPKPEPKSESKPAPKPAPRTGPAKST